MKTGARKRTAGLSSSPSSHLFFGGFSINKVAIALVAILIASSVSAEPYKRSLYRHWVDADGDCQDTRTEVLIAESLEVVTLSSDGCEVRRGKWYDPYTDQNFTNPRRLDIDHLVALREAHLSGADQWDADRREKYANDMRSRDTLIAVALGANRSKGDRDPAQWLPPNESYRCTYVRKWLGVKRRWNLQVDADERQAIDRVLSAGC